MTSLFNTSRAHLVLKDPKARLRPEPWPASLRPPAPAPAPAPEPEPEPEPEPDEPRSLRGGQPEPSGPRPAGGAHGWQGTGAGPGFAPAPAPAMRTAMHRSIVDGPDAQARAVPDFRNAPGVQFTNEADGSFTGVVTTNPHHVLREAQARGFKALGHGYLGKETGNWVRFAPAALAPSLQKGPYRPQEASGSDDSLVTLASAQPPRPATVPGAPMAGMRDGNDFGGAFADALPAPASTERSPLTQVSAPAPGPSTWRSASARAAWITASSHTLFGARKGVDYPLPSKMDILFEGGTGERTGRTEVDGS